MGQKGHPPGDNEHGDFGAWLHRERLARGWSAAELARRASQYEPITAKTILVWERSIDQRRKPFRVAAVETALKRPWASAEPLDVDSSRVAAWAATANLASQRSKSLEALCADLESLADEMSLLITTVTKLTRTVEERYANELPQRRRGPRNR